MPVQGITIVGTPTVTEVGSTDTFTVKLNAAPSTDVILSVVSGDTGEVTVDVSTLTFTSSTWNTTQTVTVTGINDALIDGSVSTNVTIAYSSGDTNFNTVSTTVAVTTTDNDVAGFTLNQNTATIWEHGGTGTFTVVLTARPTSNVVIDVVSSNTGMVSVSSSTLTFTPAYWNTAQTITVTGVDDLLVDGPIITNVTVSVNRSSSDDNFDNVLSRIVSVITMDNEYGFVLSKNSVNLTQYKDNYDTFTVILSRQPVSNVVININSANSNKIAVSPSSLTFTVANWNTPQIVTATVPIDLTSPRINSEQVSITLSVVDASSDNNFDGFNNLIVNAIIRYADTFSFNIIPQVTNPFGLRLLYNNNTYSLSNQPKGIGIANTASGKRASKRR